MGVTVTMTPEGHHEFNFDKNKLMLNARKLMNELFNDLGIHPPMVKEGELTTPKLSAAKMEPVKSQISNKQITYFGKSIAIGDFDGDGKKEAFVGAPGYTLKGLGQLGAVY